MVLPTRNPFNEVFGSSGEEIRAGVHLLGMRFLQRLKMWPSQRVSELRHCSPKNVGESPERCKERFRIYGRQNEDHGLVPVLQW